MRFFFYCNNGERAGLGITSICKSNWVKWLQKQALTTPTFHSALTRTTCTVYNHISEIRSNIFSLASQLGKCDQLWMFSWEFFTNRDPGKMEWGFPDIQLSLLGTSFNVHVCFTSLLQTI